MNEDDSFTLTDTTGLKKNPKNKKHVLGGVYSQSIDSTGHITIHYLAALHSQTNLQIMCLRTQTQKPTTTPPQ